MDDVFDDDRAIARRRLADYLRREQNVPDADADRRAGDILRLFAPRLLAGAQSLARNWWLFVVRGVIAVLFGVLALVHPLAALAAFVLVFGVWAFVDGIQALALAFSGWRSWQMALAGLVGIAIGLFTFLRPGITALGLYAAIAVWAIARGILEIAVAIELRKEIEDEAWLIIAGAASILFGVLMIALPEAGVMALAWLIAVYALFFGAIMLALAGKLHGLHRLRSKERPRPMGIQRPQPA